MNRSQEDSDTDPSEFAGETATELQLTLIQTALRLFLEKKGVRSKIKRGGDGRPEIVLQRGDKEIITVFDAQDGLVIGVFGFPDEERLRTLLRGQDLSFRIDKTLGHGEQGHYYKITPCP